MTVIKIRPQEKFATLSNAVLQDPNLSLEALGLWTHCMSRPKDWVFYIEQLAQHFKVSTKKIYKYVNQLIQLGYAFKGQKREQREGTLAGRKPIFAGVEYIFFGDKITPEEMKELEDQYCITNFQKKFAHGQNRHAHFENAQNIPLQRKEEIQEKETVKNIMSEVQSPADALSSKQKEKHQPSQEAVELANFLFNSILSIKSDFKPPNLILWAKDIDKMIRLDERRPERIKCVIQWLPGNWWGGVILSAEKLRDKFDRLELEMRKNHNNKAEKNDKVTSKNPMPKPIPEHVRESWKKPNLLAIEMEKMKKQREEKLQSTTDTPELASEKIN